MKRVLSLAFFGLIAASLHVAAFGITNQPDGTESSGGDGGDRLIEIAAATASVEEMVAKWEKPTEVQETITPVDMPQPDQPEPLPETASMAAPQMMALPQAPTTSSALPSLPVMDTTTPEPPKKPEPPKPVKKKKPKKKAKKKPKPKSQAAPRQKAAGAGGGKVAGNRTSKAKATLSKSKRSSLMRQWGATIFSKISRSKRRVSGGGRGTAKVRVSVRTDGRLVGVSLIRSSGSGAIDREAVAAVRRAGRFARAPKGLGSGTHTFTLSVKFK